MSDYRDISKDTSKSVTTEMQTQNKMKKQPTLLSFISKNSKLIREFLKMFCCFLYAFGTDFSFNEKCFRLGKDEITEKEPVSTSNCLVIESTGTIPESSSTNVVSFDDFLIKNRGQFDILVITFGIFAITDRGHVS